MDEFFASYFDDLFLRIHTAISARSPFGGKISDTDLSQGLIELALYRVWEGLGLKARIIFSLIAN